MEILTGIAVSHGIDKAPAYILPYDPVPTIPRHPIDEKTIPQEIHRLELAVQSAIQEIEFVQLRSGVSKHENEILAVHIEMLRDVSLVKNVEERLVEKKYNIESVVYDYMGELGKLLSHSNDIYLRDRNVDFFDVSKRILEQLLFKQRLEVKFTECAILVCHMLTPMDFIALDKRYLMGLVLETTGKNSHTAILARSLGIPCVGGIADACVRIQQGALLIIDGSEGSVVVSPESETIKVYTERFEEYQLLRKKQRSTIALPCETKDEVQIDLYANIEFPEEAEIARNLGAEGIGLYRSEYLFINTVWPSEEEQFEAYRKAAQAYDASPIVIRTLDIGGDKLSPGVREQNPMLGWRAVRFSLAHLRMFDTQIAALLRVSCIRELHILVPMIATLEEILSVKQVIERQVNKLVQKGQIPQFKLGIMIEVPSAVYVLPTLLPHVDFVCVGTNDLVQYIMAVDRGNEYVSNLYSPFYPSVLQTLHHIFSIAAEYDVPLSVCGEMAGDPLAIPVLIGLGLRKFSVSPDLLPQTRSVIRSIYANETIPLCENIFKLDKKSDIEERLKNFIAEIRIL